MKMRISLVMLVLLATMAASGVCEEMDWVNSLWTDTQNDVKVETSSWMYRDQGQGWYVDASTDEVGDSAISRISGDMVGTVVNLEASGEDDCQYQFGYFPYYDQYYAYQRVETGSVSGCNASTYIVFF